VSIDAHGAVTYDGERYVRVAGRATDRIPLDQVRALVATVERIGFFTLQDRYWQIRNSDGTSVTTSHRQTSLVTVRRNGESKRVEDSFGAPSEYLKLAIYADEVDVIQALLEIGADPLILPGEAATPRTTRTIRTIRTPRTLTSPRPPASPP
jgi:hypothetical protein